MSKEEFTCNPQCPLYHAGRENVCGVEQNGFIRYYLVRWLLANRTNPVATVIEASYQSTPPKGCLGARNHKHHTQNHKTTAG